MTYKSEYSREENRKRSQKNSNLSSPFQNAKRASEAAAPLATWVNANVKYAEILERIQPLEKEQNDLQRCEGGEWCRGVRVVSGAEV